MLCIIYALHLSAQSPLGRTFEINIPDQPLSDALVVLSEQSGVNVLFSSDLIDDGPMTGFIGSATLDEVLRTLLESYDLGHRLQDHQIVIFRQLRQAISFTVSGYVEDADSGERLIGANIIDSGSGRGTSTNRYGFFSITLPSKPTRLAISYLGFAPFHFATDLKGDVKLNVSLERSLEIPEVIIASKVRDGEYMQTIGLHDFGAEDLFHQTGLGGSQDVYRYSEYLPGISLGTDGIGGMSVRGGNWDQNLILMDGVPVYNPAHAIGILSIFNHALVRDVELRKGNFPARYAGRLSSVMDVRTKEGNAKNISFDATLGPLTADALIEGPIIKDKSAFLISYRRFVPNFILEPISRRDKEKKDLDGFTRFKFYDFNAKWNYQFSDRDKVYLSYYSGRDRYQDRTGRESSNPSYVLNEQFTKKLDWGNNIGILRYNRQLSPQLFANATLTFSRFDLNSLDLNAFRQFFTPSGLEAEGFDSRDFQSRINDAGFRIDFDHLQATGHEMKYGLYVTHHSFLPKSIAINEESQIEDIYIEEGRVDDGLFAELEVNSVEFGGYLEDRFDISSDVSINAGMHFSGFRVEGRTYLAPQPRLHASFQLTPKLRAEIDGSFMVQFLHLLSSSGIGLPTDLWVPTTSSVQPQKALQTSGGLSWLPFSGVQLSMEGYFKLFEDLLEYKEGASFLFSEGAVETSLVDAANWESKVTQGDGQAVGLEMMARVSRGPVDFQSSYTWSKSTRKFEDLNQGQEFPFKFDRRHSFSLLGHLRLTKNFHFSASWIYNTGAAITLAESKFQHPGSTPVFPPVVGLNFSERNGFRLPAYHRLDLGLHYTVKKKKVEHALHLDLYNAYNRNNPFYITLVENEETGSFESKQFTVLPFLPSISYGIKL